MLVTPVSNRIIGLHVKQLNNNRRSESTGSIAALPADSFANISFRGFDSDEDRLRWAAEFNHTDVLKELLDKGINVNAQCKGLGLTALMWACNRGHDEAIDLLLSRQDIDVNIKDKEGDCALERAVYSEHLNAVKKLLAHPDTDVNIRLKYDRTPLILACRLGERVDIIRELLLCENIDVNAKSDYGSTALTEAVVDFGAEKVNALLEHPDIDVNIRNKDGKTAHDIALSLGNIKAANMIAEYQRGVDRRYGKLRPSLVVNPEKFSPEKNLWTDEKITKYFKDLIENKEYDKALEVLNKTPLIMLDGNKKLLSRICMTGDYDFIEAVFDYKINKQAQMRKEYDAKRKEFFEKNLLPLSYEELKQHPMVMNTVDGFLLLMEKEEFDPNDKIENKTLFEIACGLDSAGSAAKPILAKYENVDTENAMANGNEKIQALIDDYETLGKYKLKLDKIKSGLILPSTRDSAFAKLREFINSEEFNPKMTDTMGNSLLHIVSTASENDARGLIQKLLNKGVDINAKNITGQNPIMSAITALKAARDEDTKARLLSNIKFLIDKGINIEEQDKNGQTVFHYVCSTVSVALMALILKKEPNVLVKDHRGNRPFSYLKTQEMKDMYMEYVTK